MSGGRGAAPWFGFVRALAEAGFSQTRTVDIIREGFGGATIRAVRAAYNASLEAIGARPRLLNMPFDQPASPSFWTGSPLDEAGRTLGQHQVFRWDFAVAGYNTQTRQFETTFRSLATNERLTRAEAEAEMQDAMEADTEGSPVFEVFSIVPSAIFVDVNRLGEALSS